MSGNKESCLGVRGLRGEQNSDTHSRREILYNSKKFYLQFFNDLWIDDMRLDRRDTL